MDPAAISSESSADWWARHRWPYNRGLIVAGILAFLAYAAVFEVRCVGVPEAEISGFTTVIQGFGYLLAMGVANLCFNLGRGLEDLLQPQDPNRFRERAYWTGFWFSVVLPFSIPLAVLWRGCAPS